MKSALILAAALLASPMTHAHGKMDHGPTAAAVAEQKPWGIAGDAKSATRDVEVSMSDAMRFSPAHLEVREGDTVRFLVRNDGKTMHEFVIGTKAENDAHAALMMKFPDMEHDEPWMAHVPPGKTGEIVWTFNRAGDFEFACLIAGHYQAGMVGRLVVTPTNSRSQ